MKIIDIISEALKNIKREKLKSLFTIFIVFILSFLLSSILVVSLCFYDSINDTYSQIIDGDEITINVSVNGNFSRDSLKDARKNIRDCKYVSLIKTTYSEISLYDFNYLNISGLTLDKAKNYIYLNKSFQDEYDIDDIYDSPLGEMVVKGFYDDRDDKAIVDLNYVIDNLGCRIYNFTVNLSYDTYNATKSINEIIDLKNSLNKIYDIVECYEIEEVVTIKNISKIIVVLFAFITLGLLIVSVGTISNSIIISLDKNYRRVGLNKCLGMKNKDVFLTILFQIIITVLIAVILSVILILLLNKFYYYLTKSLFDFIVYVAFNGEINTFNFYFNFPFYIPIVMLILFTIFTLIFAKTSVKRIVNASPIEIIQGGVAQ